MTCCPNCQYCFETDEERYERESYEAYLEHKASGEPIYFRVVDMSNLQFNVPKVNS